MANENRQLTKEEILQQIPDDMRQRKFSTVPIEGYTSVWQQEEQSVAKLVWAKVKKNPFIPLGLAGTVYFLTRGIFSMGNPHQSQRMMRGRVLAQGFTVTALIVGFAIESMMEDRNKKQ